MKNMKYMFISLFFLSVFLSSLTFTLNIFAELNPESVSSTNLLSETEEFNFGNLTNQTSGETKILKYKIEDKESYLTEDIAPMSGKEWKEMD